MTSFETFIVFAPLIVLAIGMVIMMAVVQYLDNRG